MSIDLPSAEEALLLGARHHIQEAIEELAAILAPSPHTGGFSTVYRNVHIKPAFDALLKARDDIGR